MIFAIDIDGTICKTKGVDYENSKPIKKRIKQINYLYENGHIIIMQTGRHWNHLRITQKSLAKWGVKFDTLVMGNVVADHYVNDKNLFLEGFDALRNTSKKGK